MLLAGVYWFQWTQLRPLLGPAVDETDVQSLWESAHESLVRTIDLESLQPVALMQLIVDYVSNDELMATSASKIAPPRPGYGPSGWS